MSITKAELLKTVDINFTALIFTAHKLGLTDDTFIRFENYRQYMKREIENSTYPDGEKHAS